MINKKCKFITFEGIDGCGKDSLINYTTQLIRENNKIFGNKYSNIWITREPTEITSAGKTLANKLKEGFNSGLEAAILFIKDRIEHSRIIKKFLNHSYVLCSRYDLSTLAYQLTQGVDFETLYNMHKYNSKNGTIIPDITIFIRVDPKIALERIKKRKEKIEVFEKLDFQKELAKNYEFVINKLKDKRNILIINGNQELKKVQEELKEKLSNYK